MSGRARIAVRSALRLAAATTAALLTGCTTGLEGLPLPAPGLNGDGITVTAVFSNALNLPAKAKVRLNGADIGEVTSIGTHNFLAHVQMQIRADIPLYVGSTAELRSATPLGDLFVAIRPQQSPPLDGALLNDGDTIPLRDTAAAATVEDLLSSAALLINGGAIKSLVSVTNGAGAAVGGRGDKVADLLYSSNTLINKLNARSGELNNALHSTSELAATVRAQQSILNDALAAGVPATSVIADNIAHLGDLVDTVARVTDQLNRFPSLQGTDTRSMIGDLDRISAAFNDVAVDPNLSLTALNRLMGPLMKLTSGTSAPVKGDLAQLAIGAWPDMNYPGDYGFHMPDGTDWHGMIGSLRYEWNLLLSRVMGAKR